jgi:L-fuculose-phosphate aldolase
METKIPNESFRALKSDIAELMKRLYECQLTTTLGGNVSHRITNGMLITPSGLDKRQLVGSDIIEMDFNGNIIKGQHEPSIEHRIHSSIYKANPHINAIVHSHPFFSTLFSIIDREINVKITAESAKNVGVIGIAEYATMGTEKLADSVSQKIEKHNEVLMKNHGIISVGKDLLQTFYRLEVAEQAAKLTYYSSGFQITTIPNEDIDKYLNNRR